MGFNRKNINNLCLKIDLHKAYDRINREFVHHMLNCMGFQYNFANLIYELISSSSFFLLINGPPYGFFDSKGGLRQGDPSSPYLFSIAMEYLSILLYLEYLNGNLTPVYLVEPQVTHLLYANDILIMAKATKDGAQAINRSMQMMQINAGLVMNENKSSMFFSKGTKDRQVINEIINVKNENLPIIHLGIPFLHNKLKAIDYGPLIDKINKTFSRWRSKQLNISERIELIKAVIFLITFWMHFSQIPSSIISKLNSLCANFIWKSRSYKMSWLMCAKPRKRVALA